MFGFGGPQFPSEAVELMTDSLVAGFAASVTIWHRVPVLAMGSVFPTPDRTAEAVRMVSEKIDASVEGAVGAAFEASRVATRMIFRPPMTPVEASNAAARIAKAAMAPANRRVAANAKRLTRGG
jgi:hypothetical protein